MKSAKTKKERLDYSVYRVGPWLGGWKPSSCVRTPNFLFRAVFAMKLRLFIVSALLSAIVFGQFTVGTAPLAATTPLGLFIALAAFWKLKICLKSRFALIDALHLFTSCTAFIFRSRYKFCHHQFRWKHERLPSGTHLSDCFVGLAALIWWYFSLRLHLYWQALLGIFKWLSLETLSVGMRTFKTQVATTRFLALLTFLLRYYVFMLCVNFSRWGDSNRSIHWPTWS